MHLLEDQLQPVEVANEIVDADRRTRPRDLDHHRHVDPHRTDSPVTVVTPGRQGSGKKVNGGGSGPGGCQEEGVRVGRLQTEPSFEVLGGGESFEGHEVEPDTVIDRVLQVVADLEDDELVRKIRSERRTWSTPMSFSMPSIPTRCITSGRGAGWTTLCLARARWPSHGSPCSLSPGW